MMTKHLNSMLSLSSIKFKRHKSSRRLPEFNAMTARLLSAAKAKQVAKND